MNGLHGYSACLIDDWHVVAAHHVDYFKRAHCVSDAVHPALAPSLIDQMQPLEDVPDPLCIAQLLDRLTEQPRLSPAASTP